MGRRTSIKRLHSLLQECVANRDLRTGRKVQIAIHQNGLKADSFLGSQLIHLFALCGNLHEAVQVFDGLYKPSIFAWSSIILAHANFGESKNAIRMFYQMQRQCAFCPNSYVFVAVLKACASNSDHDHGMLIHSQAIAMNYNTDLFVTNTLIDVYSKTGALDDARKVFERAGTKTVATWTAMIRGYALQQREEEAFRHFYEMQSKGISPNSITFICILKACSGSSMLDAGMIIHEHIKESQYASNEMIGNALIGMYMQCGSVDDALHVFSELPKQNVITWNAVISGYLQQGHGQKALELFEQMQVGGVNPNVVTFASILKVCSNTVDLDRGRRIYTNFVMDGTKWDAVMESTIIDMYICCGSLTDARGIFEMLPNRELVTWCVMVSGLVHHSRNFEALELFHKMQSEGIDPNDIVFVCLLKACSNIGSVDDAKIIHSYTIVAGIRSNEHVNNTLIDTYAKTGSIEDARYVFEKLAEKDVIAWNAMIHGYAEQGLDEEALRVFERMQEESKVATSGTFVSALKACSSTKTLCRGRLAHSCISECGFAGDVFVANALIDMYSRCESLEDALEIFTRLRDRNEFSWTAIIVGCTQCGNYGLALEFLEKMQAEGFGLNEALFVCLLSTCGNWGMVKEGFKHFSFMEKECGIAPAIDHYYCMVNLLGRIGHLTEAEDLLCTVPFRINLMGWSTLLSHCKTYGRVEMGWRSFHGFVSLDNRHAAGYVLMAEVNAMGNMGDDDMERVQGLKRDVQEWKRQGRVMIGKEGGGMFSQSSVKIVN